MRKFTSYLMGRLTSVLVFILAMCMCTVLVSVYLVHTKVVTSSPIEVLRAHGNTRLFGQHIGDDTSQEEVNAIASPAIDSKTNLSQTNGAESAPKVLNDIDIAFHIEKKKSSQLAHSKKLQPSSKKKGDSKSNQWPSHEKIQKARKAIIPLEMQIYNNPQRTRSDWNGERYIVYLCHSNITCAGWGDRQHGIFSAYLLSLVTNRTFKVDMQSPCPLFKLYHPRLLNWKINGTELHGFTSTHIYALNDREFRDSMKDINFNEVYPQDVVYLTTNYDYFYNLKANPIYREIFKQKVRGRPRPILFADLWQSIFKMNKRVVRKFTPALKQAWPTEKHKLVCAHIRFGRNPTIPTDSDVRNTLNTIKPLWKFLDQRSNPNKYRLFLASDWDGFREKVNSLYSNISIEVEGNVIHIDKMKGNGKKARNSTIVSNDPCVGFEKVIADQYVLSRCDVLLLTYSVFGKAAAYLRRSNHDLYLMENGAIKTLKLFEEKYNGP